jgi:DNA-binding response OmpR family regulator
VVDDQPEIINSITGIIKGRREVYPAKTTARAFSLLHSTKFDLVPLDSLMPGMNGMEFFEYIKAQDWYDGVPVIFVSSESDFKTVAHALSLGANNYIKKPLKKCAAGKDKVDHRQRKF